MWSSATKFAIEKLSFEILRRRDATLAPAGSEINVQRVNIFEFL